MSDSYIQAAPDSTGKLIDASLVTTGAGTGTIYRQRLSVFDPVNNNGAVVNAGGVLSAGPFDLTATGTLSAAQSSLTATSTAIANSTVVLTLGAGQDFFAVNLSGTITTSVIAIDGSVDTSASTTKWFALPFTSFLSPSSMTSLTLASASVNLCGVAPGLAQIRVRMSTLAGSDSIAVLSRGTSASAFLGTTTNPLSVAQLMLNYAQDSVTANLGSAVIPGATLMQSAATGTGAGTVLTTTGYGTVILDVTGSWVGIITVQGTRSGGTTATINALQLTTGVVSSYITADGLYEVDCAGLDSITANVTTWTSGTSVTVYGVPSPVESSPKIVTNRTNSVRATAVVHRSAITAVDKITSPVQMTAGADVISGGSLVQSGTFTLSYAFGNKYGSTLGSPVAATISTAASGGSVHAVKATGAAAVGGTPEYVDIFNSPASANLVPQWVGRCTYAQFINANGVIVTAVGTVSAGSSLGSYVIQVNILGTGLAYNVVPFLYNNAYIPDTLTAINCAGYSLAHIKVDLAVTDLRSLPSLVVVPFLKNGNDGYFEQCQPMGMNILSSTGQSLRQDFVMPVDGASGLVICIDTIAGQGAAATCVVELE